MTAITREIDIHSFQEGIFLFDADIYSPVVVLASPEQSLGQAFKEPEKHLSLWSSYAGAAGIGQYSLKTGKPAGVLSRFDIHFRKPNEDEIEEDFDRFGEQVLGPLVSEVLPDEKEKYKNCATFRLWGDEFYFTGPSRVARSVFYSRVFPGELPLDINPLVKETFNNNEVISEPDIMIVPQGYRLLHSTNGEIKFMQFATAERYDLAKLIDLGHMEMMRERLMFYPNDKSEPVDFTSAKKG